MTAYLSLEQVLALHKGQIEDFGGAHGLREIGGLESAMARPQMTFGGEDLYREVPDKAAALWHSLVTNHPLIDGNKRIGAMAAELFLGLNGVDLIATDAQLVEITVSIARGEMSAEALAIWIRQRSRDADF